MATATKTRQNTGDVAYELEDGELRPYTASEHEFAGRRHDRAGRKSRTALYSIRVRHEQAVKKMLEREQRLGRIAPPDNLHGLPLVASYMLWRAGNDVANYLSAATYMYHKKMVRDAISIDISIAFEQP